MHDKNALFEAAMLREMERIKSARDFALNQISGALLVDTLHDVSRFNAFYQSADRQERCLYNAFGGDSFVC